MKSFVTYRLNNSSKNGKVKAFTILEVTIVLALMSVIITIITVAINRFNEQMKNNGAIQQELNDFYAFRSNLWNELHSSDSINYKNKTITIYNKSKEIQYAIEDESLIRKAEKEWGNLNIPMIDLTEEIEQEDKIISFIFNWKGEPMKLHYLCKNSLKKKIDTYFEKFDQ